MIGATLGALELDSVYLGVRLGLYEALADGEPRTPPELAAQAGIAERYAREWLEQQAVAGFLEVGTDGRSFRLDAEHRRVLADVEDPLHVAPFALAVAGIGHALPAVVDGYRSGGGVAYAAYGRDFRDGQDGANRPALTHELAQTWLPALGAPVVARLESGGRVAELGSGQGWASIAVALAFPSARVDGFDADPASVEDAHAAAVAAGVDDRVRFEVRDVESIAARGPYDLVFCVEVLHDLARPVDVLAAVRASLGPGGCALVVDERVADTFAAPGDEVERLMYGWSVLHCLPSQLVEEGGAGLGTVLRCCDVERVAREAGFARCATLPLENDFFRFYRLD